ncbi:hypothetical protein QBC37DRAFT_434034 [Rhypophila decipiens]|uniref:Endo-1,3(4)-beta-glucanase 1 carbohydrate binding domain-containing protein n=1 Tax=Rhypophila decipiens TaxID=261697 RepID=A0AAN6Y0J5_9PEZI|nr:hypothetical protein QBC37DRAFT_434034 [Rhypophila decipiens]
MTLLKTVIAFVAVLAASLAAAQAGESIEMCGSAPYYPSEYTCYGDETPMLCPHVYGRPTYPCSGACYSPSMYQCCSGQLHLLPAQTGAFRLEVHSLDEQLHGRIAEVCNLQFHVGDEAETCVYCFNAPPQYVCSTYQNETVLLPSGSMSVDVPGGQYWYVDPNNGRLRTTAAGKAAGPERQLAGKNVTVYQEGYFSYDGSPFWLACKESGRGQLYGIFVPHLLDDHSNCVTIKLAAVPTTEPKEGAYSYT